MPPSSRGSGSPDDNHRAVAFGGLLMVLSRAVALPLGLVLSVFLARSLGPEAFGVYTVAMSIVGWAQSTTFMLINRPAILLVAEAEDWEAAGSTIAQLQLALGALVAGLLFVAAPHLGGSEGGSGMTTVLRILALGIPLSALGTAHNSVIEGRRWFQRSAQYIVVSVVTDFGLAVALVALGWGAVGAAWASVLAALVQWVFAATVLRLRWWRRLRPPNRAFLQDATPLLLDGLVKRLNKRVDLWAVQGLSGATAAGQYSVALSFTSVSQVFSHTLASVVLATVANAWTTGQRETGRRIIRQVLRLTLFLTPFAALGAGAAQPLVSLLFGPAYDAAAPVLAWIAFSIVADILISVTAGALAAIGHPGAALAFSGPALVLSLAGFVWLVPRHGAAAAAAVSTVLGWTASLGAMLAIRHWSGAGPSRATLLRVGLISAIGFAAARLWQVPGPWVVGQLLALCAVVTALLFLTGEATRKDIQFALSLVRRPRQRQAGD